MTQKFTVGLVQMSMSADPQENLDKAWQIWDDQG
jgi:predicted amidohydrolase